MANIYESMQAINPKTGEKLDGVFHDDNEETIKSKILLTQ